VTEFEAFEAALHDALTHLYDPLFEPAPVLRSLTAPSPPTQPTVKQALVAAIQRLEPEPATPSDTPASRFHDILHLRYVEGLTQEATAMHIGVSARYLRELQRRAEECLARSLWGLTCADATEPEGSAIEPVTVAETWSAQLERELASLARSLPDLRADVGSVIDAAMESAASLPRGEHLRLRRCRVDQPLQASIHPSALKQVLLQALEQVAGMPQPGEIAIAAEGSGDQVRIQIAVEGAWADKAPDLILMDQILGSYGGVVRVQPGEGRHAIEILLPGVEPEQRRTVLVVDDNPDLIQLYRAYLLNTPYDIVATREGAGLFELIDEAEPDVIVLDVMLPDPQIDGWELLMRLRQHPETREIPVIVCSVIRDAELALAIGAVSYLAKPVMRPDLLHALDQALNQAA
jgi:CheY-like chemotaxis protein